MLNMEVLFITHYMSNMKKESQNWQLNKRFITKHNTIFIQYNAVINCERDVK